MSIIYEALQKVERTKDENVLPPPQPIGKAVAARKTKPKNTRIVFLLSFLILLIMAIFVVPKYSSKSFNQAITKNPITTNKPEISEKSIFQNTQVTLAKPKMPPEEKIPAGVYVLQGIVYDKEIPEAVINGKNLKLSDTIDGFEVKEITPNSVKLINPKDNSELNLSF